MSFTGKGRFSEDEVVLGGGSFRLALGADGACVFEGMMLKLTTDFEASRALN